MSGRILYVEDYLNFLMSIFKEVQLMKEARLSPSERIAIEKKREEARVYIEDHVLSDDDALEWMGENDHLKSDDQEAYDYKKNNN